MKNVVTEDLLRSVSLKKTDTKEITDIVVVDSTEQVQKQASAQNPLKTVDQPGSTHHSNPDVDFLLACAPTFAGLAALYFIRESLNYIGSTPLKVGAAAVGAGSYYAYSMVPAVKNTVDNMIDTYVRPKHKAS